MEMISQVFYVLIGFLCFDIISGSPVDNSKVVSENIVIKTNLTSELLTSDERKHVVEPPFFFPTDPRVYKILPLNDASPNNNTAIKILLTKVREDKNIEGHEISQEPSKTPGTSMNLSIKEAHSEGVESVPNEVEENLKNQVEDIQPRDISDPEVELEERFHRQPDSNLRTNEVFAEDIETNSSRLHEGHITAIFAGVLAVVCIGIYVGLITWRAYLEKRYGMREQLVTQDDYYNNNDIRHFDL